jgi:Family of unknown function (DUF5681)
MTMKKRPPNKGLATGSDGGTPAQPPATAPYEVGYGKPPVEKQFKPGQSGNPKGRPPGDPYDMRMLLRGILEQRVTIKEKNGRLHTITKTEAAIMQMTNDAAKGDLAALKQLLAVLQLVYGKDLPPQRPTVNLIIKE